MNNVEDHKVAVIDVSDFRRSEWHSCVYGLEKLHSPRTSEPPSWLFDPDGEKGREQKEINEERKETKRQQKDKNGLNEIVQIC